MNVMNLELKFIFIECGCSTDGSNSTACDSTGQCECQKGFNGTKCDECDTGYYEFPICKGLFLMYYN